MMRLPSLRAGMLRTRLTSTNISDQQCLKLSRLGCSPRGGMGWAMMGKPGVLAGGDEVCLCEFLGVKKV